MAELDEKVSLYPEDYAAADEFLSTEVFPPENFRELRRQIATSHALIGDAKFRVQRGLQVPRSRYEAAVAAQSRGELTDEDFAARTEQYLAEPVNERDLNVLSELLTSDLGHFSELLRSVAFNWGGIESGRKAFDVERRADYLARELKRDWHCPQRWVGKVTDCVEEARIVHGLRPLKFGELQYRTAFGLTRSMIQDTAAQWQVIRRDCYATSHLRHTSPCEAASYFMVAVAPGVPPLPMLHSLNREERLIAGHHVRKRPANSTVAHLRERFIEEPTPPPPPPAVEPEKPPAEPPSRRVKLAIWAIAMEAPGRWWLFSAKNGEWRRRGKLRIPKGKVETLLEQIGQRGGSLTRKEALDAIRPLCQGMTPERMSRAVTFALTRARRLIRRAIAERIKRTPDNIPDPLPPSGGDCRAAITVGFASLIEGNMELHLSRQLRASR